MGEETIKAMLINALAEAGLTVTQTSHTELSPRRLFWSLWVAGEKESNPVVISHRINNMVWHYGAVYGVWVWAEAEYYVAVTVDVAEALRAAIAIRTSAVPVAQRLS